MSNASTIGRKAIMLTMSLEGETRVKKLVTVSAISMPVTIARKEEVKDVKDCENPRSNLVQIPCIRYSINMKKKSVSVLFDLGSEINAIHLTFDKELGFSIRPIDVGAQNIDGTTLDTYEMVVAAFMVKEKAN